MQARQTLTDVVLQALMGAVWRLINRRAVCWCLGPGEPVPDVEWASFPKHHDLQPSMSRRGSCHEAPWSLSYADFLLKRGRSPQKVYRTRDEARRDVFDTSRCSTTLPEAHARNGMLSPIEFERQHKTPSPEGVTEI